MKTKAQKVEEVKKAVELIDRSKSMIFVDFSKTPTQEVNVLKNALLAIESTYRVVKKRLLGLAFKDKNINVDVGQFESLLATVFSPKDIVDVAGVVYRFVKEKEKELTDFKILGGYDIQAEKFYSAAQIKEIGQLPPKEILLGQLVGIVQAPLRSLAFLLSEISKKVSQTQS